MKGFPKPSKGQRWEDKLFNRALHWCRLLALLFAAMYGLYSAGIGIYIQAAATWQSVKTIK